MPQTLIAMLRLTLHDIERYERENSATPALQEAKLAIQQAIEALERQDCDTE